MTAVSPFRLFGRPETASDDTPPAEHAAWYGAAADPPPAYRPPHSGGSSRRPPASHDAGGAGGRPNPATDGWSGGAEHHPPSNGRGGRADHHPASNGWGGGAQHHAQANGRTASAWGRPAGPNGWTSPDGADGALVQPEDHATAAQPRKARWVRGARRRANGHGGVPEGSATTPWGAGPTSNGAPSPATPEAPSWAGSRSGGAPSPTGTAPPWGATATPDGTASSPTGTAPPWGATAMPDGTASSPTGTAPPWGTEATSPAAPRGAGTTPVGAGARRGTGSDALTGGQARGGAGHGSTPGRSWGGPLTSGDPRVNGDPPTEPYGFPPVPAFSPAAPHPAEAAALAGAFAVDYLSWDEDDPERRGRVLADYLPTPGRDPARLGWNGEGRQRAEFALPGLVRSDGDGRVLVDVRVRVTPYLAVGEHGASHHPDDAGAPGALAAAPAPTGRGWRSLASTWIRLSVPVTFDGGRMVVDAWDETLGEEPPARTRPALSADDHTLADDDPLQEPVPGGVW